MAMIFFLVFSFLLQGALGEIICEQLPNEMCSFSIASSGKRCLLETYGSNDGNVEFQCKTSDVFSENMAEWIENENCVQACGLDRNTVGISSDALVENEILARICSSACYDNCPNLVDLFYNLALADGLFLPDMCKALRNTPRRETTEILSYGAASSPISTVASYPASSAASQKSSESDTSTACSPTSI